MRASLNFSDKDFAVDTTFVLFFLAVDLGMTLSSSASELALSTATLGVFVVVPYLLPAGIEKPSFAFWVAGRMLIAAFGLALGLALSFSVNDVMPAAFGYLPMTFLIASAAASGYIQLFSFMRYRLVK